MSELSEDTFKPYCRKLFGFLQGEFGSMEQERDEPPDPFRIWYSIDDIAIGVESVSCGTNVRVSFGHASEFEDYDLEDLLSLRTGRQIDESSPKARAVLLANELKTMDEDVLKGDTSIFRKFNRIVKRRARAL